MPRYIERSLTRTERQIVESTEVAQLSDREIGRFEATVLQLEHRARNDRQAMFLMEDALFELRREVDTMKARMYTAVSIAIVLGPVVAWLIDLLR